jgi:hypothetical protein
LFSFKPETQVELVLPSVVEIHQVCLALPEQTSCLAA